jgi:murein DD-endopeptidase MepM/ murein hydrolase activator NlpD
VSAAPTPTGDARRLARRCALAVLGSLMVTATLAVAAPDQGQAAGEDNVDQVEQERRRQREHQAEVAAHLDVAKASSEEVIAALTVLDQHLQSQIAQVAEAERAQRDAERRVGEYRGELGALQPELGAITNALRQQAVRLYLEPEAVDSSFRLLKADTFGDAEQRRVLGDAATGTSRDLPERARVVRDRRDALQAQANAAREQARANEAERQELFRHVVAGQEVQRRLQVEWDRRMAALRKGSDDIADAGALDLAIAEQRAKLAPSAPAPQSSNGRFIWPASGPITDGYGYLSSRGRNHWGLDIGAPSGAPVSAAQGGKVVLAGWNGDYGNLVAIDHPNGLQTRYAHLSKFNVSVGATVTQGQLIGAVGSTGNSTGPHLHFEVYLNGAHQNPRNYLP